MTKLEKFDTPRMCDCLGCEAERHPEHAELLHAMAGVYPGGPNCKKATDDLIVTIDPQEEPPA